MTSSATSADVSDGSIGYSVTPAPLVSGSRSLWTPTTRGIGSIEYRQRQHDELDPHFGNPDTMTVSALHLGEQRRLYDERREDHAEARLTAHHHSTPLSGE